MPRSFLQPGLRIKLHPDDTYASGANRGGIDERWFASTTVTANEGRAADEGLNYCVVGSERFTLKQAVADCGATLAAVCRSLATIAVYEEDDLVGNARRMGEVMRGLLQDLADSHPSVGAVRNIGLFGIVELVRSRQTMEPLAPFNGTSPEMAILGSELRSRGLYTFVRWNTFFTNPPLCISEAELREGFAIADHALHAVDQMLA